MTVKEKIKKILPEVILNSYSTFKAFKIFKHESNIDRKRYFRNATMATPAKNAEGIDSSLIFHAHSIEKGLSHPNFRPNFGKNALKELSINLKIAQQRGYSPLNFGYQEACSVLIAYKKRHQDLNIETPFFDNLFDLEEFKNIKKIGGSKEIAKPLLDDSESLIKMISARHSVRSFSKQNVDIKLIEKSVSIALNTPSVCNRQPWNVYMTDNPEKVSNLVKLQGGYVGYGIPPVISVVSVKLQDFRGPFERNEPFIDGGLFLMNFLLALTSLGLASCTLNVMLPDKKITQIKNLLGISNNEVLIAIVAIGNYQERYQIANSPRKSVDTILRYVQ